MVCQKYPDFLKKGKLNYQRCYVTSSFMKVCTSFVKCSSTVIESRELISSQIEGRISSRSSAHNVLDCEAFLLTTVTVSSFFRQTQLI